MRHLARSAAAALAAAAVLTLATGCSGSKDTGAGTPAVSVSPVAMPAPRSAPSPAASLAQPAAPGEVRVEQGPFNDRVKLTGLALTGKQTVTGRLAITADVSDTLALEVDGAYYDAAGHLVGTGKFEYQEEGEDAKGAEHHDGPRAAGPDGIAFTVTPGAFTGTPVSVVLSIPVLVSE
ncbi:hypothetical protein ACFXDJ_01200 [Streptomyces sp. NPDC059443]|uniref:hypothetical protein n=1 Tax=unclassified Streptomyces TaxID=2593676 RepID=UPI0036C09401